MLSWLDNNCDPYLNCPDYLNDLNAMHEAEEMLPSQDAQYGFCQWCMKLAAPNRSTGFRENTWLATHATAAQRAEAFLKTIDKWVEDK